MNPHSPEASGPKTCEVLLNCDCKDFQQEAYLQRRPKAQSVTQQSKSCV